MGGASATGPACWRAEVRLEAWVRGDDEENLIGAPMSIADDGEGILSS